MFEDATINIPCPGCGQKNPKRIGELGAHDHIVCVGCGRDIEIDATKLLAGVKKADKTMADFRRTLRGRAKRR